MEEPRGSTIDLPPLFRPVALGEGGNAFAHACAHAAEFGAGALVFVERFDRAEFAVVLEPDEALASARRAFYAGMVAVHDALAALAPPEKPIVIEWPDAIHVDRGLVGGGRLAWPERSDERAAPDWIVFGAAIRIASMPDAEAGQYPLATALEEEGFGDVSAARFVAGFARHLMVAIDRWQEAGFDPIAEEYMAKLKPENGAHYAIDENGDLHIRRAGKLVECRELLPTLRVPSWLDAKTGGPRR